MMKKNKFFLAGLPALMLALGMMVAGCDDGSTDDSVPSELIGTWYPTSSSSTSAFEFTSNKFYLFTKTKTYGASVSGKKVTATMSGIKMGSFSYSINSDGEMTVTEADTLFKDLSEGSPYIKK